MRTRLAALIGLTAFAAVAFGGGAYADADATGARIGDTGDDSTIVVIDISDECPYGAGRDAVASIAE